jgi:hypothetical protein
MEHGCLQLYSSEEIILDKNNDIMAKADYDKETTKFFCLQAHSKVQVFNFNDLKYTQNEKPK